MLLLSLAQSRHAGFVQDIAGGARLWQLDVFLLRAFEVAVNVWHVAVVPGQVVVRVSTRPLLDGASRAFLFSRASKVAVPTAGKAGRHFVSGDSAL